MSDSNVRESSTSGATIFGALLFLVLFACFSVPDPIGRQILFSIVGLHSLSYAVIVWHRTRLTLLTASAVVWVIVCVLAVIHEMPAIGDIPRGTLGWVALVLPVLVPLLRFAESRWHPRRWAALTASRGSASFGNSLLFRHVPDLRGFIPPDPKSVGYEA